MTEAKINCWQYMQCGRHPGGDNAAAQGICPASLDASYEGIHGGQCAGRFCWAVTGTCCDGSVQGTFAKKRDSCIKCHFYQRVQAEEGTANLRTKFLRFITPGGSLLKGMACRHIPKGTRFIQQGDHGQTAFIIQRGACIKLVERDGELHPFDHFNEGDVVGIMALLTGERQTAHVEAETDMEVWVIEKGSIDDISYQDPDLYAFLTEVVADRFESKRPTASRTIGPYVASHIAGTGGYSIVYKGTNGIDQRPVAIKMLRHHLALQPEFLDNFRQEVRIISSLRHENIVEVYDIVDRYRTVFIIMEHLEGQSLNELVAKQKRLSADKTLHFLIQACEAAAHAHDLDLIHRDLNPANMMVLPNDHLKLIDFGLACPTGTNDMEFGGALPYQAPELIEGEPADKRSDIYALGITAFQMVSGEIPHHSDDIATFMRQRKTEPVPDPITHAPGLPHALRRFIIKACSANPSDRYADAGQALEEIRRADLRTHRAVHQHQSQGYDVAAESHIGWVRNTNQDRFCLRRLSDGSVLMAVADGLGGVPAGDMAADLVVDALSQVDVLAASTAQRQLADLAMHIDGAVVDAQHGDPDLGGMGSTLILVWMHRGWAFWAHVGDSRLYLLRDGCLKQATQDQTLARYLVAEGEITSDQVKRHYSKDVMDQHLGCGYCEPETNAFELRQGDVLLLCSDGLYRGVTDKLLEQQLDIPSDSTVIARNLVDAALVAGGRDNITSVVARIKRFMREAAANGESNDD